MIEKMTKYSFVLLSLEKEGFLESLRDTGVVDITRSTKPVDAHSQKLIDDICSVKDDIRNIRTGNNAEILDLSNRISELNKILKEVEPWGEFDLERLKSLGLEVHFYVTPTKNFKPEWIESSAIEIISEIDGNCYFIVLGDNSSIDLRPVQEPSAPASVIRRQLEEVKALHEDEVHRLEARLAEIPGLEKKICELEAEFSLYLASEKASSAAENSLVVFEGFAPSSEDSRLATIFDTMDVYWEKEPAHVDDNPPIMFRNNRFVRLFEPITDMYGRPKYDGFDPTPYISVFFLLFFAMCMGDMGYGMILAVLGILLKKSKSFASLASLVVVLGVGTMVIGFLFHTFFSIDISQWAFIPDSLKEIMVPSTIAGFDGTMVLAIIVGFIHLSLAMIVKTVYATKNKGFLESLSAWGWTLLFVGASAVGAAALAGVIDTASVKIILIILGIISAIGIFPLNNIHRNPLINIGAGLWDSYNFATGILGDVLSYLRLYALGLAGAMLGYAFNDIAAMALGNGGLGWIPFILIILLGHTLNLAMAGLGAFVHPIRLNFLEFFKNSDYDGSGLKYNPLKKL